MVDKEKKTESDDLWAKVRGVEEDVKKVIVSLEKLFGIDIN